MASDRHSDKTNLAFVSNSCWSVFNFRAEVLLYLQQKGFHIHVVATRDAFTDELIKMGFTFHEVNFDNRQMNPVQDLKLYYALKRIYKQIQPALIFHYVIKPNIYGSVAASRLNIPSIAVITGLGYSFSKKNLLLFIVQKLYKYALKKVNEVWFLNAEDAYVFEKAGIGKKNRTRILHSEGIDTEKFSRKHYQVKEDHPFTFLMSTRLLHSKGVGVYAKASAILKAKGYVFVSKIIGFFESHHPDSVSQAELKHWIEKKYVQYDGFAKDVLPHLLEADCFILPSTYPEGVPRSLLEGSSLEIPLITTNNIGCREVIKDEITGFVCKMNNPEDLADKMERMMKLSSEERKKMGAEGRKHVQQHFDMQIICSHYLQSIEKYINNK